MKPMRYIELQGIRPNYKSPYPSNIITTSIYTKYNFLIKALFKNFSKFPKLWFLLISILEISGISQTTYQLGTLIPLTILTTIFIFREGFSDYYRHSHDQVINFREFSVWNGSQFILKYCKDLLVGDIIALTAMDEVPADIMLLSVGNEEHQCYVDASEVIGEGGLKVKSPAKETQAIIDTLSFDQAITLLNLIDNDLHVVTPSKAFKSFRGKFRLVTAPTSTDVTMKNLILRGMKIVHTPWVIGVVVYTGVETKVWINNLDKIDKESKLSEIMEKWLLWGLGLIFVLSGINTGIYSAVGLDGYTWPSVLVANILMYNHVIPTSLLLSVEIVRLLLNYLIRKQSPNIFLNDPNLCSNLGMIEYIVTDKTGTLTDNQLRVAMIVIENKIYIDKDDYEENSNESERQVPNDETSQIQSDSNLNYDMLQDYSGSIYTFKNLGEELIKEETEQIRHHFFYCLSLCNLAIPEDGEFLSISLDDKVLAYCASTFGFRAESRDESECELKVFEQDESFYVIGTQAFASEAKRSRIIVKKKGSNEVFMYIKGRKPTVAHIFKDYKENKDIEACLLNYRCLYLGYKKLSKHDVEDFLFEYSNARMSLVNREGRVESVFEKFEKNAKFLGIIGIDDGISDDTKTAVRALKGAGIKFWVLSGDSADSTLTSSLASGVFDANNKVLKVSGFKSELDCLNYMESYLKKYVFPGFMPDIVDNDDQSLHSIMSEKENQSPRIEVEVESIRKISQKRMSYAPSAKIRRSSVHPAISKLSLYKHLTELHGEYNPKNLKFVLSIDSKGFEMCLETHIHLKYFTFLLFTAKAVIFHSLLPDQKAKIINLMTCNFRFRPMIMAVGDSMSDTGMIQQAHVGVALQGSSICNSADVVIDKFSDLTDLLLISGHRQYIQISKMVLLSFYAMSLIEFVFSFYNMVSGWTGTLPISPAPLAAYELVASIIPLVTLCLLDEDSSSTKLTPQAYKAGIFNSILTVKNLFWYVMTAMVQSIFIFITTLLFFNSTSEDGKSGGNMLMNFSLSFVLYNTLVVCFLVEAYTLTVKLLAWYLLSLAIGASIVVPLSYTESEIYGVFDIIGQYDCLWCYIFLNLLFSFTSMYLLKVCRYLVFPGILELSKSESPNNSLQNQTRIRQYSKKLNSVFRNSAEFNKKKEYEPSKLNSRFLFFSSKFLENQYQEDKLAENMKSMQIIFLLAGLTITGYNLLEILTNYTDTPVVIFHTLSSLFFLLCPLITKFPSFRKYSSIYICAYYIIMQVFFLISQISFQMYSLPILLFTPYFFLLGFSNHWLYITVSVILSTILSTCNFIMHSKTYLSSSQLIYHSFAYTFIYLTLCTLSSIITYHIDKSKRLEFLLIQKVLLDIQKTKGVLNFLLPTFVRKRVKDGVRFISENQGVVSIIFCDIENFETLLKEYGQKELTIFLDELFSRIDHICLLSGCTKIETVGKTYMACAGLKESEQELEDYYSTIPSSRRCVEMAAAILRLSESIHFKNSENIRFKIGIHTGEVTAGVVGYHKPQFSLVGDTVNTASRMASLCPEGNLIQISQAAYDAIGETSGYSFTRHQIEAKGKGLMNTFLVSPPLPAEPVSSSSKLGISNSLSLSELFTFKSVNRSRKQTRRTTLYNFSNQHADHDQRRSSLIEILNEDISPNDTFIRRETEIIEKVRWFTFSFFETMKEKKFRIEISETSFPVILWSGILRIVCNGLLLVLIVIEVSVEQNFKDFYELVRLVLEIIAQGWILLKMRKRFNRFSFVWTVAIVYMLGAVSKIGINWRTPDLIFADFIVHSLQVAHCSQLFFKHFIWIALGLFSSFLVFISVTQIRGFAELIYGLFICLLILTYTVYLREKTLRFYSNITKAANKELKRINELLTEMMPKHVFETLREQNTVTEKIKNATILYADIVGFTQWSSSKTPGQVVNMLSDLFTQFDMKCKEHQVYKVHTIGDCYVAMGYLEADNRDFKQECKNLIYFALDLVKIIQEVNLERGIELNMRIGVHTGDIIGGITGTSIVRYDIYGVDVLIANKMESSGQPGKVKVSQETFDVLSKNFNGGFKFVEDKVIEVAGKKIKTYFVELNN